MLDILYITYCDDFWFIYCWSMQWWYVESEIVIGTIFFRWPFSVFLSYRDTVEPLFWGHIDKRSTPLERPLTSRYKYIDFYPDARQLLLKGHFSGAKGWPHKRCSTVLLIDTCWLLMLTPFACWYRRAQRVEMSRLIWTRRLTCLHPSRKRNSRQHHQRRRQPSLTSVTTSPASPPSTCQRTPMFRKSMYIRYKKFVLYVIVDMIANIP